MESVYLLGSLQHVQHEFVLSISCVTHSQAIDKNAGCAKFIIASVSAFVTHMCISGSLGHQHVREVLDAFE